MGMKASSAKSGKGDGVRPDVVREFRRQIKNKSYQVKSGEIASRIAGELFSSTAAFKGQVK